MDHSRRQVSYLFSRLDGDYPLPQELSRRVLEKILQIDPGSERAQELLDGVEGKRRGNDLAAAMEKAEDLAMSGYWELAQTAAETIGQRFGHDPVAQAWLRGISLLWQA